MDLIQSSLKSSGTPHNEDGSGQRDGAIRSGHELTFTMMTDQDLRKFVNGLRSIRTDKHLGGVV